MPWIVFGTLDITTKKDLGEWGPAEGTPVVVHWPVWRSLLRLVPGVVLLGLLLLPGNRDKRAWLAALPVALAWLGFTVLRVLVGLSSATSVFVQLLNPMSAFVLTVLFAQTVVLLRIWPAPDESKGKTAVFSLLVALAAAALIVFTCSGVTLGGMLTHLIPIGLIWLGVSLTRWRCRRKCRPGRFVIVLMWDLVFVALVAAASLGLMNLASAGLNAAFIFGFILMYGLFSGVFLTVLVVPYMFLTAVSPYWQERVKALLHWPRPTPKETDETALPPVTLL